MKIILEEADLIEAVVAYVRMTMGIEYEKSVVTFPFPDVGCGERVWDGTAVFGEDESEGKE